MLTRLIVVIILQCIHMAKHHIVYHKYKQILTNSSNIDDSYHRKILDGNLFFVKFIILINHSSLLFIFFKLIFIGV